jgi:non-heme chloroperoxidase
MPDTIPETCSSLKAVMLSVPLPALLGDFRSRHSGRTCQVRSADSHSPRRNHARAPLPLMGVKTATLIKGSKLVVYEGAHASGAFLTEPRAFIAA